MQTIDIAESDKDILDCLPVLLQLRPKLSSETFLFQVREQYRENYLLASLKRDGVVRAVAGFRMHSCLSIGRFLYVDDLVTDESVRGQHIGSALFNWLTSYAKDHGCRAIQLDSGTQRFEAHRFYLVKGMDITCHHFTLMLESN